VELTHGTNRRYTVEWGPASLGTDAWSAVALTLIAVVFVTVTWFACTTANKTERPETLCLALTCVPLIVMAYVSVRHLPIAAIWTAPAIARLASRAEWSTAFRRAWFVLSGPAVLPACLTLLLVAVQPQPVISAGDGVLGRRNPCRAVAFMKANGVTGNVFSPLWWGSYVSWELYPAVRVSMDGRNISLFPDRMVIENFDFYLEPANAADLDAPLRYPTDYLLVPTDSPVLSRIEADGRWRPAFRDGDAALFVRTDFTGVFASAHPPLPCSAVFQ